MAALPARYAELPSQEVCLWRSTCDRLPTSHAGHAGLCFRRSKDLNDTIHSDILNWGQQVKGVLEDKNWVRVTDKSGAFKFLPTSLWLAESGSVEVLEKVFARDSRFPGEAAVAILAWLGAWASIVHFIKSWSGISPIERAINIGPYVLCCAIAVQVRFVPPVGVMLPLPEGILSYLQSCSRFAACVSLLIAVLIVFFKHVHFSIHHLDFNLLNVSTWFAASIFFAVAAFLKKRASKQILLAIQPLAGLRNGMPLPPRPFTARIHGYLYAMFSVLEGGPVIIQNELGVGDNHRRVIATRLAPKSGCHIDVWVEEGKKKTGCPIYFYIHGGYWKTGGVRMTQHVHLMQILASRGWFVVSVQYRKRAWPMQLEDSEDALKWVCGENAAAMGADRTKIIVGGSGAGGQLAAMLTVKALRDLRIPIMGNVLFYPNLDPGDSSKYALRFGSFSIVRAIFTECVLGGKTGKWKGEHSPDFVGNLSQIDDVLKSWPPVFVVHGSNDSVVPVETSRLFLEKLAKAKGLYTGNRRGDVYLEIPGARHSFDIVGSEDSKQLFGAAADWCQQQAPGATIFPRMAPMTTMAPKRTVAAPMASTATVFQTIPNYTEKQAVQVFPKQNEVPAVRYQEKIPEGDSRNWPGPTPPVLSPPVLSEWSGDAPEQSVVFLGQLQNWPGAAPPTAASRVGSAEPIVQAQNPLPPSMHVRFADEQAAKPVPAQYLNAQVSQTTRVVPTTTTTATTTSTLTTTTTTAPTAPLPSRAVNPTTAVVAKQSASPKMKPPTSNLDFRSNAPRAATTAPTGAVANQSASPKIKPPTSNLDFRSNAPRAATIAPTGAVFPPRAAVAATIVPPRAASPPRAAARVISTSSPVRSVASGAVMSSSRPDSPTRSDGRGEENTYAAFIEVAPVPVFPVGGSYTTDTAKSEVPLAAEPTPTMGVVGIPSLSSAAVASAPPPTPPMSSSALASPQSLSPGRPQVVAEAHSAASLEAYAAASMQTFVETAGTVIEAEPVVQESSVQVGETDVLEEAP